MHCRRLPVPQSPRSGWRTTAATIARFSASSRLAHDARAPRSNQRSSRHKDNADNKSRDKLRQRGRPTISKLLFPQESALRNTKVAPLPPFKEPDFAIEYANIQLLAEMAPLGESVKDTVDEAQRAWLSKQRPEEPRLVESPNTEKSVGTPSRPKPWTGPGIGKPQGKGKRIWDVLWETKGAGPMSVSHKPTQSTLEEKKRNEPAPVRRVLGSNASTQAVKTEVVRAVPSGLSNQNFVTGLRLQSGVQFNAFRRTKMTAPLRPPQREPLHTPLRTPLKESRHEAVKPLAHPILDRTRQKLAATDTSPRVQEGGQEATKPLSLSPIELPKWKYGKPVFFACDRERGQSGKVPPVPQQKPGWAEAAPKSNALSHMISLPKQKRSYGPFTWLPSKSRPPASADDGKTSPKPGPFWLAASQATGVAIEESGQRAAETITNSRSVLSKKKSEDIVQGLSIEPDQTLSSSSSPVSTLRLGKDGKPRFHLKTTKPAKGAESDISIFQQLFPPQNESEFDCESIKRRSGPLPDYIREAGVDPMFKPSSEAKVKKDKVETAKPSDPIFVSLRNEVRNWIPEEQRSEIVAPEPGEYGSHSTVVVLSGVSSTLLDTDFYRLGFKAQHRDGWVGGLLKVVQSRDAITYEPMGQYYLFFHSKPAALAYTEEVKRLYELSRRILYPSEGSKGRGIRHKAVAAPQSTLTEEEEEAVRSFSLVPPSVELNISLRIWSTLLMRELATKLSIHDVVKNMKLDPAPPGKVLLKLDGSLAIDDLWQALRDDGRERNAPWQLANLKNGIVPVKTLIVTTPNSDVLRTTSMTKVEKTKKHERFARFILTFTSPTQARRFVRNWHKRTVDDRELNREIVVDATALW